MPPDQEPKPFPPLPPESAATDRPLSLPPSVPGLALFDGHSVATSLVRVALFLFVVLLLVPAGLTIAASAVLGDVQSFDSPGVLLYFEAGNLALVFGLSRLLGVLERRDWGEFGLPVRDVFGKNFWLGGVAGLAGISLLMGGIAAFGGYSIGTLALGRADAIRWGIVHLLLFLCVGLYEEYAFRGYAQFTLGKGIGFWPAAILLSTGFGLIHLTNKGESMAGAASVAVVGLFFAFTLRRTGNLWYAVGLHASFDWGESFLYSVPDSGEMLRGHLTNALLTGPSWLTGGRAGPEGSVFCFLTMGLEFLLVLWLFPKPQAAATLEE